MHASTAYRKRREAKDPAFAEAERAYQRAWFHKARAERPELRKQDAERAGAYYRKQIESRDSWSIFACRRLHTRARIQQIECNISPADIPLPEVCPVLGVPFVMRGRNDPFNPSVDRLNPKRGYVVGNVRVISRRANVIKSDSVSPDELRKVADYMEREFVS